jgi:hypothetical protein
MHGVIRGRLVESNLNITQLKDLEEFVPDGLFVGGFRDGLRPVVGELDQGRWTPPSFGLSRWISAICSRNLRRSSEHTENGRNWAACARLEVAGVSLTQPQHAAGSRWTASVQAAFAHSPASSANAVHPPLHRRSVRCDVCQAWAAR